MKINKKIQKFVCYAAALISFQFVNSFVYSQENNPCMGINGDIIKVIDDEGFPKKGYCLKEELSFGGLHNEIFGISPTDIDGDGSRETLIAKVNDYSKCQLVTKTGESLFGGLHDSVNFPKNYDINGDGKGDLLLAGVVDKRKGRLISLDSIVFFGGEYDSIYESEMESYDTMGDGKKDTLILKVKDKKKWKFVTPVGKDIFGGWHDFVWEIANYDLDKDGINEILLATVGDQNKWAIVDQYGDPLFGGFHDEVYLPEIKNLNEKKNILIAKVKDNGKTQYFTMGGAPFFSEPANDNVNEDNAQDITQEDLSLFGGLHDKIISVKNYDLNGDGKNETLVAKIIDEGETKMISSDGIIFPVEKIKKCGIMVNGRKACLGVDGGYHLYFDSKTGERL